MVIIASQQGRKGRMVIAGAIDLSACERLQIALQQMLERCAESVELDLSLVAEVATPGVAVLVEALQRANRLGRRLVVKRISHQMRKIMDLCNIREVFTANR